MNKHFILLIVLVGFVSFLGLERNLGFYFFQGAQGDFWVFFGFFGVRDRENRVQDEILINSNLLAPPDLNFFIKFHENP